MTRTVISISFLLIRNLCYLCFTAAISIKMQRSEEAGSQCYDSRVLSKLKLEGSPWEVQLMFSVQFMLLQVRTSQEVFDSDEQAKLWASRRRKKIWLSLS